jgi:hypothetical protein
VEESDHVFAVALRLAAPYGAVLSLVALALTSADLGEAEAVNAEVNASEPVTVEPRALVATSETEPSAPVESGACPGDMVEVSGWYCPKVEQPCLRWLDPPGKYENFRCAEYGPSKCVGAKKKMSFCIDRNEYTAPGESLPANHQSLMGANRVCKAQGKRLCRESEWNFACEGEQMSPYPYGSTRDSSACNADRQDLVDAEGKLRDFRSPSGSFPRCQSPFGVNDMAGNLEEMVQKDGKSGFLELRMKGAYWQPSHNNCRAAQGQHDAYYSGTETGFRCCADIE